jgi:hypothetical protein
MSSTPSAAAATLRWAAEFDFGAGPADHPARTLIVHRVGNGLFDLASVGTAVKLILDARCAELPGCDELPYLGDTDALLDVIQEFLTGMQGGPGFLTAAWRRCCSPTSSGPCSKPADSATGAGGTYWTSITPVSAGCSTGSAAPRLTPRETVPPPSTGPPGPSGAPAPCGTSA